MRKYLVIFLIVLPLFAGCMVANVEKHSSEDPTIEVSQEENPVNDFFVDYYEKCKNGLLQSLEDRLKNCDASQEKISGLPTEDLVKLFIDYPLNYLVLVYDNPQDAVSIVVNNSEIHKELLRRDNAAGILLQYYKESEIDLKNIIRIDDTYKYIPYSSSLFFEYFLASKYAKNILESNLEESRNILNQKIQDRLERSDIFSSNSIRPLLEIGQSLSLSIEERSATTTKSGGILGYTTIYTPLNHQALEGLMIDELSSDEISYYDALLTSQYPTALKLNSSSAKYNCHSYAWHYQSTNNTIWLDAVNSAGALQLQKYWTNDLYCEYEESYGADIVYYSMGDHSGVIVNNRKIVSKWGRGPLMRHDINDCPYLFNGRKYFIKMGQPSSGIIYPESRFNIVGDERVLLNTWHEYHLDTYKEGRDYQWTFTDLANPNSSSNYSYICNSNSQGKSYSLKCGAYGGFLIRVDEYIDGINTAFDQMYVISMGAL